jgi:RIO-like serine/threonine protein kinase
MHEYFQTVVTKLTGDDMSIIGALQGDEGKIRNSAFKAMNTSMLQQVAKLSRFKFKTALTRLLALQLVGEVSTNKCKSYYLTIYGQQAIEQIFDKESV